MDHWTKEVPTTEGFYWLKNLTRPDLLAEPVRVQEHNGELQVYFIGSSSASRLSAVSKGVAAWWAGPIYPPTNVRIAP